MTSWRELAKVTVQVKGQGSGFRATSQGLEFQARRPQRKVRGSRFTLPQTNMDIPPPCSSNLGCCEGMYIELQQQETPIFYFIPKSW